MSALTDTVLHTARLTLRPPVAGDLPDLAEVNGDEGVTAFLPYEAWRHAEDGGSWLRRMNALASGGTGQQWVLELRATRRVVGTLLLFRYDAAQARAEVGYALGRAHWGQGLMKEALSALCDHAFRVLGLRRLEAEVNPANSASNGLLARVGFRREGTLRQRWSAKGRIYDTHIHGLLASEWPGATMLPTGTQEALQRPLVGVGVLVVRDGRLLLGLRRGAHGAGTWALPGGHLEHGESVHDCAVREVFEETGLRLTHTEPGPWVDDVYIAAGRRYVTLFVVARAEADAQARVMEPERCEGWAWHAWAALPEPLFPPVASLRRSGYTPT